MKYYSMMFAVGTMLLLGGCSTVENDLSQVPTPSDMSYYTKQMRIEAQMNQDSMNFNSNETQPLPDGYSADSPYHIFNGKDYREGEKPKVTEEDVQKDLNKKMTVSESKLAEKIRANVTALPFVKSSLVIVTGNDVYVAVKATNVEDGNINREVSNTIAPLAKGYHIHIGVGQSYIRDLKKILTELNDGKTMEIID